MDCLTCSMPLSERTFGLMCFMCECYYRKCDNGCNDQFMTFMGFCGSTQRDQHRFLRPNTPEALEEDETMDCYFNNKDDEWCNEYYVFLPKPKMIPEEHKQDNVVCYVGDLNLNFCNKYGNVDKISTYKHEMNEDADLMWYCEKCNIMQGCSTA